MGEISTILHRLLIMVEHYELFGRANRSGEGPVDQPSIVREPYKPRDVEFTIVSVMVLG